MLIGVSPSWGKETHVSEERRCKAIDQLGIHWKMEPSLRVQQYPGGGYLGLCLVTRAVGPHSPKVWTKAWVSSDDRQKWDSIFMTTSVGVPIKDTL